MPLKDKSSKNTFFVFQTYETSRPDPPYCTLPYLTRTWALIYKAK